MTPAPFAIEEDRRCQRGLRYLFRLDRPYSAASVTLALQQAFGDRLVRGEEAHGDLVVVRLILQFRFELRLARNIELLQRMGCAEPQRHADLSLIIGALGEALGAGGA